MYYLQNSVLNSLELREYILGVAVLLLYSSIEVYFREES
jgi:hypothetical protein